MPLSRHDETELKVVWQYQIEQLSKELDLLNRQLSRLESHHEKKDIRDALGETTNLRKKYAKLEKSLENKWKKSIPRIQGVNSQADSYCYALQSLMNQVAWTAEEIKKTEERLSEAWKALK